MAIVSSFGALTAVGGSPLGLSSVTTSGPFYDGYRRSYAEIYRTQPAVRTVIDFFSRNIAQLGLQAFRRVTDTDRVRLTSADHGLVRTFRRPNPSTSRYRFIESTVQDIGTFANGYWLKVRLPARELGLVRLPAAEMSVKGVLLPVGYTWQPTTGGQPREFAPSEIVHFRLFDPANAVVGFPPLETLRRVLAEAAAAGAYREEFWRNSGRFETVIERPANAPNWNTEQREEFRSQWQEFAGRKAGKTPVLEDGMMLKPISFNAKDSQYAEGLRLTREFVAAQFHVPLPMVGILDHATFSNVREQHKQLYQDCLGPWLVMLEEDIELQLLPDFEDVEDVYVEFNIAEKLKGSFEEQADSLARAVGRPYMTANEARARLNLPWHDNPNADDLADVAPGQGSTFGGDRRQAKPAAVRAVLEKFAARQHTRLEKDAPEVRASKFNHPRWTRELAADLRAGCGADFCSVWGEDADRVAGLVNSETWALLEDGAAPWSRARVDALVSRFTEDL
jgi:HK97 family phage portal protein